MNGGLTQQELELWKRKAANLDDALEYVEGRADCEKLMQVERILRRGIASTSASGAEPLSEKRPATDCSTKRESNGND